MIDIVAKAICCGDTGCKHKQPAECMVDDFGYRETAKHVLKAMREPSKEMICAVLDAHDKAPRTMRVIDDWQVMIDRALAE